jgi:hypothetical protein
MLPCGFDGRVGLRLATMFGGFEGSSFFTIDYPLGFTELSIAVD